MRIWEKQMTFLDIQNLSVRYDGIAAVQNASLSVGEQEAVVLIGANGSGKSSVLRALFGLVPHTCDRMTWGGVDIRPYKTRRRVQAGLALVPETREIFTSMSVEDNLRLGLFLHRSESMFADELERIGDLFPILKSRLGQQAGTLSGGEQQMLALARALMQKPRLLCLDEPSLGLAPKLVGELYDMLHRVREQGVSILLVEQQARRALRFGARGYVLNVGEIVRQGDCESLAQDDFVQRAYLAGSGR